MRRALFRRVLPRPAPSRRAPFRSRRLLVGGLLLGRRFLRSAHRCPTASSRPGPAWWRAAPRPARSRPARSFVAGCDVSALARSTTSFCTLSSAAFCASFCCCTWLLRRQLLQAPPSPTGWRSRRGADRREHEDDRRPRRQLLEETTPRTAAAEHLVHDDVDEPNAIPMPPPLPACKSTTRMRKKQTENMNDRNERDHDSGVPILHDLEKVIRFQRRATHQRPVDVGLIHQERGVVGLDAAAI